MCCKLFHFLHLFWNAFIWWDIFDRPLLWEWNNILSISGGDKCFLDLKACAPSGPEANRHLLHKYERVVWQVHRRVLRIVYDQLRNMSSVTHKTKEKYVNLLSFTPELQRHRWIIHIFDVIQFYGCCFCNRQSNKTIDISPVLARKLIVSMLVCIIILAVYSSCSCVLQLDFHGRVYDYNEIIMLESQPMEHLFR